MTNFTSNASHRAPLSCSECRTTWEILRSCLMTILACTWIALHPNIPSPGKSCGYMKRMLQQTKTIVVALVAPDVIVLWACRQWLAASEITDLYKVYRGWTETHSFFALMGGFASIVRNPWDSEEQPRRLSPYCLHESLRAGHIRITDQQIKDRSKGDGLVTILVMLQATWFTLQFFARLFAHYPVTEIELVTLAFCALNFVTYAFWRNKPYNVKCVVEIEWDTGQKSDLHFLVPKSGASSPSYSVTTLNHLPLVAPPPPVFLPDFGDCHCLPYPYHQAQRKSTRRPSFRLPDVLDVMDDWTLKDCFNIFARPFSEAVFARSHESPIQKGELGSGYLSEANMPYYYGHTTSVDDDHATRLFTLVAIIFGAIHCSGWAFSFPTDTERLLWYLFSVIITIAPVYGYVHYCLLNGYRSRLRAGSSPLWIHRLAGRVAILQLTCFIRTVYILARIILLVQMFFLLRSLSNHDPVFQVIDWANLIPHV